jgi:amidase
MRRGFVGLVIAVFGVGGVRAQLVVPNQSEPAVALPSGLPVLPEAEQARMDRDLMEVDIPRLQDLYARHVYTVEQVTRWYLTRIAKYNGIYRDDVQTVDVRGALETARREDAGGVEHGPLWGVPMVIKANTAVKGLIDTDGWAGFVIPGHEFVAERDATVVAKLRAAGAVILGITNMPDFAIADTTRSTAFGRTGNAYDVRFSPGGSSGGTVTAVTSNEAMVGTGSDTACSITMPAGTSSVVGVLPTRGLTSIAGIAPLDWLRDNTGPVARNVTDAAIALGVMAGEDDLDFRTKGSAGKEVGPYTKYLKKDALKGKRFGVPAFMLETEEDKLRPETRAMLMQAVEQMRAAGAVVVIDEKLLPLSFYDAIRKIVSRLYLKDGADQWISEFGPAEYRSGEAYTRATGVQWPAVFTGERRPGGVAEDAQQVQAVLASDPDAEKNFFGPQREALREYVAALDEFHLDGLVFPSAQMETPDETMPQNGGLSTGPESHTGWVNRIGVPVVVVPGGFYPDGLPFGLEISARPWKDGELLGWAYGYEQSTGNRRAPVLVEKGLLPIGR